MFIAPHGSFIFLFCWAFGLFNTLPTYLSVKDGILQSVRRYNDDLYVIWSFQSSALIISGVALIAVEFLSLSPQ